MLQDHEKERLHALLTQHRLLFACGPEGLGRTKLINMTEHRIDTQGPHPIRQQLRSQPHSLLPEIQAQTRSMLEREVISPSSSPWASPIVLVKKRNGTYRFCVDYRHLNAVTVKDSYPLPRIDQSLDSLDGATIFTTLDLALAGPSCGQSQHSLRPLVYMTSTCCRLVWQTRPAHFSASWTWY